MENENKKPVTRLIGKLGPDAALAEAIAASLYSRLTEGEKAGFPPPETPFVEPSLRDCLPLAEKLIVPLRSQCAGKSAQEIVFKGLNARSVYRVVTKLAKACGLEDIHPHTLRHYFATRLVELGVNLRVIQELLGHADLSTTSIYLNLSPQHLKNAIDVLDRAAISSPLSDQTGNRPLEWNPTPITLDLAEAHL